MLRFSVATICLAVLTGAASASSITLDFGVNQGFANFGTQGTTADISNVATGINARFTSLSGYSQTQTGTDSFGAPKIAADVRNNDFRIRADEGETAALRLQLFDANFGNGFQQLFTSATPFEWSLIFYDLDTKAIPNSFDSVLLKTVGTASLSQDTLLITKQLQDGLLVSAEDMSSGNDANAGVETLSSEQQRYSVEYTVQNTSMVEFDYIVGRIGTGNNDRVALIDGGTLTIDDPVTITVAPIPLPAGVFLLLGGLGALSVARRAFRS
ncbi:MAG: VPLPA-CTERM sorting domain-containing protein [Parvularcula sp.]|jgi:hypothetical protein|nr:VPLPA-CTERM sorting domain-containing protein [Parvularcula sp.]